MEDTWGVVYLTRKRSIFVWRKTGRGTADSEEEKINIIIQKSFHESFIYNLNLFNPKMLKS